MQLKRLNVIGWAEVFLAKSKLILEVQNDLRR